MPKPDPEILRDLARVAVKHRLDGGRFPAAVDRLGGLCGREPSAAVRRVVQLVRWRGGNLSADGVAAVLRGSAAKL